MEDDAPDEGLLKPIHFRQAFNIVKVLRCGGKIMLNMIAWGFGASVAREAELDALRRYVLAGEEVEAPVRLSIPGTADPSTPLAGARRRSRGPSTL